MSAREYIFESDLISKRFIGLLLVVGVAVYGFVYGDPVKFNTLATFLGLVYAAYVGGQSYTDGKALGGLRAQ